MPAVLVLCLSGRLDTVITLRGEKSRPRSLEERSSPMCTCTEEPHARGRLVALDVQRCTLAYATMNNTLAVLTVCVASQVSAHTVCKSLCHLSTFRQDRLKGDSHTPFLPPTFFSLSPSFALLLPPLCLCPWWPSYWVVCLTALTPCAWADVNSLMVSVLLLLWQAFLHSADVRRAPAEVERTEGSRPACVSAERGGNTWNIWEHRCTSSAAWKLVGTSVDAQVQQECSAVYRCCSGPLTYVSVCAL